MWKETWAQARMMANRFLHNEEGTSSLTNFIISIVVAMIIMAFLIPIAINQYGSVNTSGANWSKFSGLEELWGAMPIIFMIASFIAIMTFITKRA